MTKGQELIQSAFEEDVKRLYAVFVDAFITNGATSASENFTTGLNKAKEARDCALGIVERCGV